MDDKKIKKKEALIESLNNYAIYKKNMQKIYLILKENKKYEKNILKYYNLENDEHFLKISFLFFSQYNQWINPYNIILFPYKEHFEIIKNEFHDKFECLLINEIDTQNLMKLFTYWLFFLLNDLEIKVEFNNDDIENKIVINDIINVFFLTNNKLLNIYANKKIETDEAFIFLYIYLFYIEYNTKTIEHEKQLKIINSIIFDLFFDLFEKISLNILSENTNIEQAKKGINIFIVFLDELKINPLIMNDYNIITLLDSNNIQSFIQNILNKINPKIMEKVYPNFSDNLADFYLAFLKFRFIKGKAMKFLISNTKNSFINLKYIKEEKEKIINDIYIQKFQSDLLQKIFNQENRALDHPNFSSFLFNGNSSKMSFKMGKKSFLDNMIIFSFKLKSNYRDRNLFNERQTLFCFYNYCKQLKFKLLLKKINFNSNNDKNSKNIYNKINNISNKNKNNNNLFLLNIIINGQKDEIALNELDIIEPNLIYYICIFLSNSNIKLYLISSKATSKLLKSSQELKVNLKEDNIILNIGYDSLINKTDYYSGYIGNFYIIKCNYKNKTDYENIIEIILQLKDYYRYIIFYLKDNTLENKTEYNLDYLLFYKNKNDAWNILRNLEKIKNNQKLTYENILSIYPELFKFLHINEKEILNNYQIPKISGICEKQTKYLFNEINITYVKYDLSKDIFVMRNGFNYFCLQFEYFFQFANYYLFFINKSQQQEEKENDDIATFYKENIDICIKSIKHSINNALIILSKYIVDLNIINFSAVLKQIFTTLLAAMKALNNISCIIDPIFHQISGLSLIVSEQLKETFNIYQNDKYTNDDINFLISFRDSLIDFLFTNEFYLNAPPQYIESLFQNLMSTIEGNIVKDITVTNPNIFLKILNLTPLLVDSFSFFDLNTYRSETRNSRGKNALIYSYLKIIKGLIIRRRKCSNDDLFFKQIFNFALRDCRHNLYIIYAFLSVIYDLLIDEFSLDEFKLEELMDYYDEIKYLEIKTDSINEKNLEKLRHNLCSIIILILMVNILENNRKLHLNRFFNDIKEIKFDENFIISIIKKIMEIFSKSIDPKKIPLNKNMNNDLNNKNNGQQGKKNSSSNNTNITFENFSYMNFYEDLFEFILILLKKIINKDEENNNINKENQGENPPIIHFNEQNKIKFELINILFIIEELLNTQINVEKKISFGIIYCLINFVKLIHIITFDDKLIDLFKEQKFLYLFENILELCKKSKLLYTTIYINPNGKTSSIYKTIPETVLDVCIKLITSDKIITDSKEIKDEKLDKIKLLEILYEIYLTEKKSNNQRNKKFDENKIRSLFCYNDIYRYLFSKKLTKIESDIVKLNKEKIYQKYFPQFGKELIIIYNNNNILLSKEKKFNCNFITFNVEKIYKFYNTIESSSCSIKNELLEFFDTLLTKIIKEHVILYELDQKFFFKANTNYSNYIFIKTKIETYLNTKSFDDLKVKEILQNKFFETNISVYEFVTSGLCENINENKKPKYKNEDNKSSIELGSQKRKSGLFKLPFFSNSHSNTTNDNYNITPPSYDNGCNSVKIESDNHHNINNSRSNSVASGSDDAPSSHNEDILIRSETSSNSGVIGFSPENIDNKDKDQLSDFGKNSTTTKATMPTQHVRSKSNISLPNILNNNEKFIINKILADGNSSNNTKKNLIENINEINDYCFFNKLDNMYLFNIKRDLMKNVFSIDFIDTIFYDKVYSDLKKLFLQNYGEKIDLLNQNNTYLNYPTKIKNFSNGIEPPLFLKPFNNFFDYKIFPITHQYFYNHIQNCKQKYKYKYINLFQKPIIIYSKEKTCEFSCELIKIDHAIYGNIIYSKGGKYLYFIQDNFENKYNAKKNDIYYDGLFSLSMMKYKEKENMKNEIKYKSKRLMPLNKNILILISEIEEIVERRFLLMWQGFEIYLKDGRSYFFNLFHESKYEKLKSFLLKNNELEPLIHKKDYLSKNKLVIEAWEKNIISNYEFLLLINKYSARSFNEPNQYYVFPWILTKFKNLVYINNNENKLYLEQRKISSNANKSDLILNEFETINSLRNLKYPVSQQSEYSRNASIYRYSEDEETKFPFHLGTHYSTAPFIYYYLMRQEPYNTLLIKLQNYQQENPNRMFIGMKETVEILESGNDNRELIPEFFSKIEFFLNLNCAYYGFRANGTIVNNVNIDFMKNDKNPQISLFDYVHFIYEHKKLLNSSLISSSINDWINNIFGVGQLPSEKLRKNSCNIFRKTTYENKTNLIEKIKYYKKHLNEKYDESVIRNKLTNKINLIISFGQTPYQVFKEQLSRKIKTFMNDTKNNLGYNKIYNIGEEHSDDEEDVIEKFSEKILRPNSNLCKIRFPCIYFELNNNLNKIFALSQNEEVVDIKFQLNNGNNTEIINFGFSNYIMIPHIKFLDKIRMKNDYYIYKPKYSFSSFKNNNESNIDSSSRKSSSLSKDSKGNKVKNNNINYNFNKYYKDIFENMNKNKVKNEETYKFITCRYLDNSFKLYKITKIKNPKKKEKEFTINIYSYICEDFVSSCCTISSNEFVLGLENGKLIKWKIVNEDKNKIELLFNKNIQAHKCRINAIEIYIRLGLIITCGNDNYVQIRKLYNFELLTPIQINKKYTITMAKVSNNNFLYVMCYNKIKKKSIIFGYTLTGIKFAKSQEGYFCNIDFTQSGNIVSLFNFKEICILNGYNLARKEISEEESGFKDFNEEEKKIAGSVWMEFKYFANGNNGEDNNIIIYIKKDKRPEENVIFYHDFKDNKIFE